MRRRDFLLGVTSSLISGWPRQSTADASGQRAAVVIGVDKPGSLPKLTAASSGARQFAEWLQKQGFEVKLFADDIQPVKESDIFATISKLVERGTLQQLVVYFSGHGFLIGHGEYWLLSEAPSNPNASINLSSSIDVARQSGIENVVFISDACRSSATSLNVSYIQGTIIFPTSDSDPPQHTYIDQLLASRPGKPAYEAAVSEAAPAFSGIFTHCLLTAFKSPPKDLIATDTNGLTYVPTRRLEKYLEAEVMRVAEEKSVKLRQRPDLRIESAETIYICTVQNDAINSAYQAPISPVTVTELSSYQLARVGLDMNEMSGARNDLNLANVPEFHALSEKVGYDSSQNFVVRSQVSTDFETRSGFVVTGARVVAVATTSGTDARIVQPGDGYKEPAFISTSVGTKRAGTVAVQFADGSGTILAAIPNFVGSVAVSDRAVANVSYLPAKNGDRWSMYEPERERLDELRAAVATAAKFGEFRLQSEDGLGTDVFAGKIRILKGIDPTLGMYAAYAYFEVGNSRQVNSIVNFMRGDLGFDLFDVYMLSNQGRRKSLEETNFPIAPVCPMLTQGWNLLEARFRAVPPVLVQARANLRPSLWTTLEPDAFSLIKNALQDGVLR